MQDCYTPLTRDEPNAPPSERVLEAHRTIRYDALLQLIGEVQRRRSIADVAQVVAARWKHCANVANWRLLCVYGSHAVLLVTQDNRAVVQELDISQLPPYDAELWQRQIPRHLNAEQLVTERAGLPPELALAEGVALNVLPVQQGNNTIGILSTLGIDKPFDLMDKKFIALVAGAMATRIVAILTEETLSQELLQTERLLLEQRHAGMLGRLVNGVAHELNTPLGVQISACDGLHMLLADPDDIAGAAQDIVDTVQLVEQQAKRCAGVVKRLKQISAASQATPPVATPLVEELQAIALPYGIEVTGDESLTLTLDRNALQAVVTELLDNARNHGGGETSLTVSTEAGCIHINISDKGPGMDEALAARLFEPFTTTKQSAGNIGIGGYIAHNLAKDALRASLTLKTQPQAGTYLQLIFAA